MMTGEDDMQEIKRELAQYQTSCAVQEQKFLDSLQPADAQLLAAYDARDVDALCRALERGANPDVMTGWNGSPLAAVAAYDNWHEAVEALLDAGANPMAEGGELLVSLCERGPAYLLRRVLQVPGVSPDFESGGDLLAVLAAEEGQLDCLRVLRAAGADLLADEGKALCRACAMNQPEVVRYLLAECGADVEAEYDDKPPLFYAVQGDAVDCARLLLEAGADPDHADLWGRTPRNAAASVAMNELLGRYCR